MQRAQLPPFLADFLEDRTALRALAAACLALAAAGLDPHVLDPGSLRGQAILGAVPATEWLFTLATLAQVGLLLLGGAVADTLRSGRLLRAALVALAAASVGAILMPAGPGLLASRFVAWASDGVIIPFAVGAVALLYRGEPRATALGVLFTVYGATTLLAPALSTLGTGLPEILALLLCAAAALLALWATHRWLPALPPAPSSHRRTIVLTAVWAFGVVAAVDGLVQAEPWLVGTGGLIVGGALLAQRAGRRRHRDGIDARRTGAALAAGVVIGFSQGIPLLVLPLFFTALQGVENLLATAMLAPFVIGLVTVGPLTGLLLSRFTPRLLLIGGTWAIALADLAFFAVIDPTTPYAAFVVPFVLVGAGFVAATAVRTAVIFASTPRAMPATAAALNEASIGVGARLGTTLVILVRTGALGAIPETEWLRVSLLAAAIAGAIGGIVIFLLLGRGDPVRSVWDLREERAAAE
jgi:DHA2 family methylenomycin A resistance protein-like MFS transporter